MTIETRQHRLILPLEGYRALAILAVLLFHLDKSLVPGGYLGVDLFFVISGFIITKRIVSEREAGTFKLSTFYMKRIRRLFPALLITVLVTLIASYFILSPETYSAMGKSALYSLFSLANINFWMETGYFDAAAKTKPLLHMWSLSVEEQFYLFWPFILVLLAPRRWKLWAIALFILSFTATIIYVDRSPETAFFWFPFRVYEFMGGAILSILGLRLKHKILSNVTLVFGALIFVAACITFNESSNIALTGGVSVLACVLLLLSMESPIANVVFGNPIFVWLGQRSYSIYLVHWPLIVLYVYSFGFLSHIEKIGLGIGSVILGMVLQWAIEEPFRHSNRPRSLSPNIAFPSLIAVTMATFFISSHIWAFRGFPLRLNVELSQLIVKDTRNASFMRDRICFLSERDPIENIASECIAIDSKKRNMLLVGSSFAADLNHGFQEAFPSWKVSQITQRACVPRMDGQGSESCNAMRKYVYETLIGTGDYDIVIISGIGLGNAWEDFLRIQEYMDDLGQDFVIIGPRPVFLKNPRDLIAQHGVLEGLDDVMKENLRIRDESRMPDIGNHYYSSVHAFCELEEVCLWQKDGKLLYQDKAHLSPAGSIYFGKRFADWLNERGVN